MTSVEQQTADRGPAVSADDDVGDVEIVLDADEDEDDGDAPAVGGEVSEAAQLKEAEKVAAWYRAAQIYDNPSRRRSAMARKLTSRAAALAGKA